ncbi:hypothetical protein CYMTET_8876 [Cymbomonas tetramitiformis]|uniref:Uncharacterized protein n=1 Tax=Cymbomonas tetramitiformis TaxID=36881 RepID=A0AAE0GS98_9CHLO|nr:hypothetical protein CYMTET_8876 [Cymbomonas tetramitiformis]
MDSEAEFRDTGGVVTSQQYLAKDGIVSDKEGGKSTILNLPPIKSGAQPLNSIHQSIESSMGPYINRYGGDAGRDFPFGGTHTIPQANRKLEPVISSRIESSLLEHQRNLEELIKHQQDLIEAQKRRIDHLTQPDQAGDVGGDTPVAGEGAAYSRRKPDVAKPSTPRSPRSRAQEKGMPVPQPGILHLHKKNFVAPTAPQPGNGPFMPGSVATRSMAVQAGAMEWTRYFFPKFNCQENSSKNSFFKHFDVCILEPPPENHPEVTLVTPVPFWLGEHWDRLYFSHHKRKPNDTAFNTAFPKVNLHRSEDITFSGKNILESESVDKRIQIEDFMKLVARMHTRSLDDMPALCALQAGLLWYVAGQLEGIGLAAEEAYRLRELKMMNDFTATLQEVRETIEGKKEQEIKQMNHKIMQAQKDKWLVMSKVKATDAVEEVRDLQKKLAATNVVVTSLQTDLTVAKTAKMEHQAQLKVVKKDFEQLQEEHHTQATELIDYVAMKDGTLGTIRQLADEGLLGDLPSEVHDILNDAGATSQQVVETVLGMLQRVHTTVKTQQAAVQETTFQLEQTKVLVGAVSQASAHQDSVQQDLSSEMAEQHRLFTKKMRQKDALHQEQMAKQHHLFIEQMAKMEARLKQETGEKAAQKAALALTKLKNELDAQDKKNAADERWKAEKERVIELQTQVEKLAESNKQKEEAAKEAARRNAKSTAGLMSEMRNMANSMQAQAPEMGADVLHQMEEMASAVVALEDDLKSTEQALESKMDQVMMLKQDKVLNQMKVALHGMQTDVERKEKDSMSEGLEAQKATVEDFKAKIAAMEASMNSMAQEAEQAEAAHHANIPSLRMSCLDRPSSRLESSLRMSGLDRSSRRAGIESSGMSPLDPLSRRLWNQPENVRPGSLSAWNLLGA